jgi:MmyB-like transcription regulator ligand binding domain
VQWILDGMTSPALVRNGRLDILAGNQLGYALYSEMFDSPIKPANSACFAFLDPRARDFYLDWERAADEVVAVLRSEAGRDPHDRALQDPPI